jgi:ribosome-associated translation inhibitor RaiA
VPFTLNLEEAFMKKPVEIRFLGMERSAALEADVRSRIDKLELFCPEIISCCASLELVHKHQQQGRPYSVRIDATMPGHELTVSRVCNEDVHIALRTAFDGMKRQIADVVQQRHVRGGEALKSLSQDGIERAGF